MDKEAPNITVIPPKSDALTFEQVKMIAQRRSALGHKLKMYEVPNKGGWEWYWKDSNDAMLNMGNTTAVSKPVAFVFALLA